MYYGTLAVHIDRPGADNDMINATKLLNVAGIGCHTSDGILESEKVRHIAKVGPMRLRGVWIPLARALHFANKEKITELLYPLFVHKTNASLYTYHIEARTLRFLWGQIPAERLRQRGSLQVKVEGLSRRLYPELRRVSPKPPTSAESFSTWGKAETDMDCNVPPLQQELTVDSGSWLFSNVSTFGPLPQNFSLRLRFFY